MLEANTINLHDTVRDSESSSGITPRLILVTNAAGNPTGGRSRGASASSSAEFSLN